jgi:hypothetical protein
MCSYYIMPEILPEVPVDFLILIRREHNMPAPQDDDVANVADEIVRYLAMHAHAADGLDGIAKWWLAR